MNRDEAIEMILDPDRRPPRGSAEHEAFLAYLETSPECRSMYEQQQGVWEALEAWEPVELSAGFDERLYERIEQSRAKGFAAFWSWLSRPGEWIAVARPGLAGALAALLLAAGGIVSYQPQSADRVAVQRPWQAETEFVEQIDQALDDIEMLADFEALVLEPEGQGRS